MEESTKMNRTEMQNVLKSFLHEQLVKTRFQLGLTQEEMAEILAMDTRSYIELDHGNNACGTLTLILFLLYCCDDPNKLLDELRKLLEGDASYASGQPGK